MGGLALDLTMRNSAGVKSNVEVICNAGALDDAVVIGIVGVICSVGSLECLAMFGVKETARLKA